MRALIRIWPLSQTPQDTRITRTMGFPKLLAIRVWGHLASNLPAQSEPHVYDSNWPIRLTLGHTRMRQWKNYPYAYRWGPYAYGTSQIWKGPKFVYLAEKNEFPSVGRFFSTPNTFWRPEHWRIHGGSRVSGTLVIEDLFSSICNVYTFYHVFFISISS